MKAAAPASTRFLARMVERAGERAPSVMPRLPGWFESPLARPSGLHESLEDRREEAQVESVEPSSMSARTSSDEARALNVAPAGFRAESPRAAREDDDGARAVRPAHATATEHAFATPAHEPALSREFPDSSPRTPTESATHPPRSAALLPVAARAAVECDTASSSSRSRDRNADAGAPPTPSVATVAHGREEKPTRVLMPQPVRWTPLPAPSVPAQATIRSAEHATASPAIHISIGRVEVCALPAAPAQAAREKARRPMSLEEYFKRQERAR